MRLSAPGAMDCSLAAIQQPGLPQQLLVSSGRGELALVSTADTGTAVSAPVQPLPQAQPFILEAGYRVSAGRYLAGPLPTVLSWGCSQCRYAPHCPACSPPCLR